MQAQNEDIMNAIIGTGAQNPASTLSTGIASQDMSSSAGSSGLPAPTGPGQSTPNYMQTAQQFGQQQQPYNPLQQMYNPMIRHGIGKDNWSSNMGLDQQAILNNLGLGGQ
jgi:hypothetical protein